MLSTIPFLIISFLVTLFLGVPVAFILGISAIGYFTLIGDIPLAIIGQALYNGINSFTLLALPFFILAGQLMNKAGITEDLIDFARLLVGRLPGALAQVNIVVSILFAGLTGAAVADTAAIGSILIPAMKKEGYTAEYAAAITTTSSIIGPIIPPSIIMVIYATVTGASVGTLFMAGIVPGILIGVGLMIMATYYAIKEKHPRRTERIPFKEAVGIIKNAILSLLVPIIIIGGILSGIFTPTEAAAVACFYAFILGFVVFRTLSVKDVINSIYTSGVTSSIILLIISTAQLFGNVLSFERVPQQVASIITNFTDEKIVFLLMVNVFLLFMGMVMETGANVIILAPILLPVAIEFGVHPLHFALVMLINVNIGLTTPPLGVCIFTAAPIAKTSFEKIAFKVLPLVAMQIAVLLLITYVPEIVLFLPRLLELI